MKAEHTPGPWHVRFFREGDPEEGFFVEAAKTNPDAPYNIEILSEDLGYYPIEQRLADARLVSAAPELLESLQWLVNQVPELKGEISLIGMSKCYEAIKKATL